MFNFLTQLIGFIALILLIIVFQREKRSHMLILKILSSIFYGIHFALLGAWTGSAMNVVAAARSYVFKQRTEKKWADNKAWLFAFLILIIVSGIFTWGGYYSLLPMIGTSISTAAFWMKKPRLIRLLCLIGPPFWLVYNIIVQSIAGMVTELLVVISILVGILRFDGKKK